MSKSKKTDKFTWEKDDIEIIKSRKENNKPNDKKQNKIISKTNYER